MADPVAVATVKEFAIEDQLSNGKELLGNNVWKYLGLMVLSHLIIAICAFASWATGSSGHGDIFLVALGVLTALLTPIVSTIMLVGLTNIQIRIAQGRPYSSNDLWTKYRTFVSYFVSLLLIGFCVCLGLICLIVPGIYLAITFSFTKYFVVGYGLGPIQAMRASAAITEGSRLEIFLLSVVLTLICGIAAIIPFALVFASMYFEFTWAGAFLSLLRISPEDSLPDFARECKRKLALAEGVSVSAGLSGSGSGSDFGAPPPPSIIS